MYAKPLTGEEWKLICSSFSKPEKKKLVSDSEIFRKSSNFARMRALADTSLGIQTPFQFGRFHKSSEIKT